MRFNAEFKGVRTTVRISDELWSLFVLYYGSEQEAVESLRFSLTDPIKENAYKSASDAARADVVDTLSMVIRRQVARSA